MQYSVQYYESIPPEILDFNDPDIPETIKIRARNELEKRKIQREKQKELEEQQIEQIRHKAVHDRLLYLLTFLSILVALFK